MFVINYINTLYVTLVNADTGWLFKRSCYSFDSLVLFAATLKVEHLDLT